MSDLRHIIGFTPVVFLAHCVISCGWSIILIIIGVNRVSVFDVSKQTSFEKAYIGGVG